MSSNEYRWDEVSENAVSDWYLPGQGEKYPTCGKVHYQGCLQTQYHLFPIDKNQRGKAYIKKVRYNCGRAQCPECNKSWMVEATKNIEHRIEEGKPPRYRRPIHVTISPPASEWSKFEDKDEYPKMRRKATRLAKKAGLIGFVMIPHAYRQNSSSKLWRFSPHFHLIGYGWIVNTKWIYERTGWIIKNHRIRKSVGATAYYQLSHAGVKEGRHVFSWCGCLAWNKIKVSRLKKERQVCPLCGAPTLKVIYHGRGSHPLEGSPNGEYYLDSDEWRYTSRFRYI